MKVYSQLEVASIENLASDPSLLPLGRFWFNTTDGFLKVKAASVTKKLLLNDGQIIIGTDGTANNNIRAHRGAAGVLQFVTGGDTTTEGTLSTSLNKLSFKFEGYADGSKPAAGNAGRVAYITDLGILKYDNGASWLPIGSGGGGGSVVWSAVGAVAPLEDNENGEKIWKYVPNSTDSTIKLTVFVKVPQSYLSGTQVKMYVGSYSPSSANTQLLKSVATLIRKSVDAVSTTTNQRTSTNAALTNTVADQLREHVLDLTDSSGLINGVAVTAGDIIKVELGRGSDTDTADLRFLPNSTELKFS